MTVADVRTDLADALRAAGVPATVHPAPPTSIVAPAVLIVPAEPYLTPDTVGPSVVVTVSLSVRVFVSRTDPVAELTELERIVVAVLAALPDGWTCEDVERPSRVFVDDNRDRLALTTGFRVERLADLTPTT